MISSAVIVIVSFSMSLIMSGVMFIIARNYPKSIQGLSEWFWSMLFFAIALPLFLGRGHIPAFASIVVANFLILVSFMLMNQGMRKFTGESPRYKRPAIIFFIGTYILWFVVFTYIQPNINLRVAGMSFYTLVVTLDQLAIVLKRLSPSAGKTLIIFSILGLIAARIIRMLGLMLGYDQPVDVLDATPSQFILLATPAVMLPLATVSYLMLASEKLHRELEFMALHDDLTGCLNKKAIMNELQREAIRANRYQHGLSLMVVDIDDFKRINDVHGHLAGDRVLIDFVQKTNGIIRRIDQLGRFGGDEFIILLPEAGASEALLLADRMRESAAISTPISWSISIGVSEWRGVGDTLDDLFARADGSLYKSKQLGKNRSHAG